MICLPPEADEAVGGGDVEAVVAPELGGDRFLQLGDAVDIGVFGLALVDGADRRVLDVLGRVEVGLAGRQRDDVAAGALPARAPSG